MPNMTSRSDSCFKLPIGICKKQYRKRRRVHQPAPVNPPLVPANPFAGESSCRWVHLTPAYRPSILEMELNCTLGINLIVVLFKLCNYFIQSRIDTYAVYSCYYSPICLKITTKLSSQSWCESPKKKLCKTGKKGAPRSVCLSSHPSDRSNPTTKRNVLFDLKVSGI